MLSYPSSVIQVDVPGGSGRQSVHIPEDEVFRVRKIFEDHEYGLPEQYLPSGDLTVVDIGANVGLFALYMKNLRPNCEIYCFEPAEHAHRLLAKNIGHLQRIHRFSFALSNRNATAELHLHPKNSGENSLKFTKGRKGQTVPVDVRNAAEVFQQIGLSYIDIIKIDTEGCEVEILKSLRPLLPFIGILMVEYHCESDRRSIDALLCDHLLLDAKPSGVHLGMLKYINARLYEMQRALLNQS